MKPQALLPLFAAGALCAAVVGLAAPKPGEDAGQPSGRTGPVRVLFLGHESKHHNSNKFYPMLAKGLGRDGIYFDYVTTVGEAFDDVDTLNRYDAVLLYANHGTITPEQWRNLKGYISCKCWKHLQLEY